MGTEANWWRVVRGAVLDQGQGDCSTGFSDGLHHCFSFKIMFAIPRVWEYWFCTAHEFSPRQGVYADRTAGGHRHHCDSGVAVAAGLVAGETKSPARCLRQQSAPGHARLETLRG